MTGKAFSVRPQWERLTPRCRLVSEEETVEPLLYLLSADGVTVLVTTHYLDEAEHCHRVAIIHGGRLAALGTTGELKDRFRGRTIIEVEAASPVDAMRELDRMPEVEKTSVFGTAVHAVMHRTGGDAVATVRERLAGAGIAGANIVPVEPYLEDVFLDVVVQHAEASRRRS